MWEDDRFMLMRHYIGTAPRQVICVDEIFTIHYFEYVRNFEGLLETHDFWEMVYVDCGLIDVTAGDRQFPLRQGEAYFHQPNEAHSIDSTQEFSSVFIISYRTHSPDAAFLRCCRAELTKSERGLISSILQESTRAFSGALDIMDQTQLVRSGDAPYGAEQVIKALLEYLLISVVRSGQKANGEAYAPMRTRDDAERRIVDAVIRHLTNNLYARLSLDEICHQVMFSKSYVGKRFKESMGCGIINYFNRLKIGEAKRLISEGTLSFTDIAERLNFGSIHYFSRVFKAFVGMNPSEYAQSVKVRGLL